MTDEQGLARECVVFFSYLGSAAPHAETVDRYIRAHANLPAAGDRFDHALVAFARGGPVRCSLADAYARRARPYGLLRRKLTLALALLESGRTTHARYDQSVASPFRTTFLMLGFAGVWWALRSLVALVVVGPVHLATIVASGGSNG